jgi:hypothetical protein
VEFELFLQVVLTRFPPAPLWLQDMPPVLEHLAVPLHCVCPPLSQSSIIDTVRFLGTLKPDSLCQPQHLVKQGAD